MKSLNTKAPSIYNFTKNFLFVFVVFVFAASCKKDEPDPPAESPNTISIVSGNFQFGLQYEELDEDIQIKLEDATGNGLANKTLIAEVTKGDSRMVDESVSTNNSGIATFRWELKKDAFNNIKIYEAEFPTNFVELSATSNYKYSVPEAGSDGWTSTSIDNAVNNSDLILEGVDKVRFGIFPEVHSIVLAVDGQLILDAYFSGTISNGDFVEFDRHTPHELHSASKTFRSALIGIAIEEGQLSDENTPLSDIFPQLFYLTVGGKENIKLEHVLTMSTGLEWDETSPAPNSLSEMYTLPYDQWHEFILQKPLVSDPGTTFVYNTGASLMLNRILLEYVEPAILPFIEEHYSDLVESNELYGAGFPYGASEATPREMAKLGQVYANEGKWKNNQVISKEWIDKSIAPAHVVTADFSYGYQWWITDIETAGQSYSSFSAIGFGGQHIIVIKELDLVAVFTGGNFQTEDKVLEIMSDYILPAFE